MTVLQTARQKSWGLHLGVIALLFLLQFVLPEYHHGNFSRIMVLACFAMAVSYTHLRAHETP